MKQAAFLLAVFTALAVPGSPAQAGPAEEICDVVTTTKFIGGKTQTYTRRVCYRVDAGGQGGGAPAPYDPERASFDYNAFIEECNRQAARVEVDAREFCLSGEETEPQPITAREVQTALSNLPLPPSELEVQPPNGRTLVNFDTNFFTERPAFTRVVTLLGQRVTLRIEPSSFTWHFDHGAPQTTTTPGARYPRLLVTHDYEQEGTYRPRVDTTYTATFRVGGGAWRPVPGSVTITGPTVALQAVEAQPVLTAP